MPQPYQYLMNVEDPTKAVLSGLQAGVSIRDLQRQQQEREIKLAQAQRAEEQALAMQKELAEISKNPTPSALASAMVKYPQLSEQFKRTYDVLNSEQKQARLNQASQVYAALQSGKPEIAIDYLGQQASAYRNSGDEKSAKTMEDMAKIIEASPGMAKTSTGLFLSSAMGPDKFSEAYSTLEEEQRKKELQPGAIQKQAAEVKKLAVDAGLSEAKANESAAMAKKLGAETGKIMIEMEKLAKQGPIDPEKKFDFEDKLRKQYVDRTKNFVASKDAYSKIVSSANDASGAGDIALVTSFMKMLDPGSVVRETEFATARDTAGLVTQLKNQAQKLQGGSFLDSKQRNDFKRLAEQYMNAAIAQEQSVRSNLMKPVKEYGLSEESVFGGDVVVPSGSAGSGRVSFGATNPSAAPAAPQSQTRIVDVDY